MNTRVRNIAGRQFSLGILQGYDISAKVYALVMMVEGAMSSTRGLVKRWIKNANGRRDLARLSPRMLQDIGLEPFDVQREIDKPFWRS